MSCSADTASRFSDARFPPRKAYGLIRVAGSNGEMGLQHGRAVPEQVAGSVELYRVMFAAAGLTWAEALTLAGEIRSAMFDYDAALLSELDGIAAGSGQDPLAIVAINSRTEILTLAGRRRLEQEPQECTSAACLPEVTADGHTLIGRNWDQDLRLVPNILAVAAEPEDDPNFVMLTEAGILIRDGVNEAGVGVTGNALYCDQDGSDALGMPVGFVRRRVMRHSSLASATKEVFEAPRSASINHLLAAAGGGAVSIEATPRDTFWVLPRGGIVTHSNHFLAARAAVTIEDLGPRKGASTLYRNARLEQSLKRHHGVLSVDDMRTAFNDHFSWPESVCSHPKVGEKHPTGSVATVVMDLDERTMWVAAHPVCQSEWRSYAVP